MTAQEDGFSQLLVVKTAEAAASPELEELRLELSADGLDVQKTDKGGLQALDSGARGTVFEAPRPMMWDSSAGGEHPSTAPETLGARLRSTGKAAASSDDDVPGAGESGKLAPVLVDVPTAQDAIVLTPNADVLKGNDTTYPVYIDPQWYSPRASAWTMASKYWSSSPQWKFNGDSDSGMGYCNWSYCSPNDTKRLFYQIPVSKFAGKSILSAEFVVNETWAASCSTREVELWQTKGISSSTTWNTQTASGFWIRKLQSKSFAYGYSGCAAKDAEFDIKSAMQAAASSKSATMTFGLRAASETDRYGWKRFSDKAFVRVKYNRPPAQVKMSQLTMEYGGACKSPSAVARVRTLGKIYANNVTDPDGDKVAVQFQAAWNAGDGKGVAAHWSPSLTSSKSSGSDFSISLPSSIPVDKTVSWHVRSYDGAQYSSWSSAGDPTACYFIHDGSVPKAPTITSTEYPASDPENPEDPWFDGVGKYGYFDIKAADADVVKYWIGFNGSATSKNTVITSGGALKTVPFLPARAGLNFVTAVAIDAAGKASEERTYQYRVKAGQPERAMWEMDGDASAGESEGSSGARSAILHGGASTGVEGRVGTALHVDGATGYAETDIPTVNTANGFSVSAWVKLDKLPETAAIIAAQPGNHSPGFELYYSHDYSRWVFNQFTSDSANASIARAMAPQPGGVNVGEWTHLVGIYSGLDKALHLYVNGDLAGSTPYMTAWDARRGLQIGAGQYNGNPASFFPGTIDELRIFDKPISSGEVTHLYHLEPLGNGRTARAVFPLDEPVDVIEVEGHADTQPLTLSGGAQLGADGVAGDALQLDGTTGYARTVAPHTDTQRPFTVSAWAKLDRLPSGAATVIAQLGTNRPGYELYYSKDYNRWGFKQFSGDVVGATQIAALQPEGTTARAGEWVHLVGVHDQVAQTLTLYVNGLKAGSVAQAAPFYAGGAVQVGALSVDGGRLIEYFPGRIDDVRVYDRAVSAEEVTQMFQQRPLVKSRWTFEETAGTDPVTVPDAAGTGNTLSMRSGATHSDMGWIDFGAMALDGSTGYATASGVPVDTSGSFTLTAWAQAAALPRSAVALAAAEGVNRSAFTVRFVPDTTDPENRPGTWELAVTNGDTVSATVVRVGNGEFYDAREWNHIALVYDGFAKQARLYVNGGLAEVSCTDADGDGASDDTTCEDQTPWAENVLAFKSTSLQVGRSGTGTKAGAYFPGLVDDVWTFQGALTSTQVEKLAASWFDVPTQVPGD
ncbi:LamG-like jellyroll fold domain-containing protein [Streptomyces sp. NPDC048182]|uniref:LamG-like jellyroll fold domain-containing protein n=1 Tax=Streptomyces sp. NPDC048182 TaxID=3365507 RepID=UPI003717C38F